MLLLQKMHGKQITESLGLPYPEPTGQQAGDTEAEVAPLSCFTCKKGYGDGSKLGFDPLLLQSLLSIQSGPCTSSRGKFKWTFTPSRPAPLCWEHEQG